MRNPIKDTLTAVRDGALSVEDALLALKKEPFSDIGYAKVDLHRSIRQGAAEVIYGAGKTPEQILGIIDTMLQNGQRTILITRLSADAAEAIAARRRLDYHCDARIGVIGEMPTPDGIGKVLVATGGTSDIPVAEEAALTARLMGNEVKTSFDVGVAGIHRLLHIREELARAAVVIVVAGMEGALASVVGGMLCVPVIGVPTSIGYGSSFGGLSSLLAMLNSCASNVVTVNIDNGFGAGYVASLINRKRGTP